MQFEAFNDTWRWSEAVEDFHEVAKDVRLSSMIEGLRKILGEGSSLAYLSYMANRLRECWRVLKPSGSIYLHCDPTMSHYLKVVMDAIFNEKNFRREIVWNLNTASGYKSQVEGYIRGHDTIFYYLKNSNNFVFNKIYQAYKPEYVKRFRKVDEDGRKYRDDRTSGKRQYLDESPGVALTDVWSDVMSFQQNSASPEIVGYPTQKPLALVERIIEASTNKGDVVLDPFCGCGTTVTAAESLSRFWIGIDVCHRAYKVIEDRLNSRFQFVEIEFIGMPRTIDSAHDLARRDKFKFEKWAASIVDGIEANKNQRGDKGIDGRGRVAVAKGVFIDLVSQVKGGHTGPGDVQAFNGARQEAEAHMGIFTCFEKRVTQRMRDAAASTGRFRDAPVIQIYTVDDWFNGKTPEFPKAA